MIHLRKYNESAAEYISNKKLYEMYSEIPTISRLKRDLDQEKGLDRFKGNMQESVKKAVFEIGRDFGLHGNGSELFLDNERTKLVIFVNIENDFPGLRKDLCYRLTKFSKQWYVFKLISKKISNWTEAHITVYISSDYINKFLCLKDNNSSPSDNYNTMRKYTPPQPPPPPAPKVSIDDMKELMKKIKDKRK